MSVRYCATVLRGSSIEDTTLPVRFPVMLWK